MAKAQKNHQGLRHILATDLDGTLVGDVGALRMFNGYMARNRNDFLLVYTTGRIFSSVWELILHERLILPHVLITDVGTEIRFAPHFKPDKKWDMQMKGEWNREKVQGIIDKNPLLTVQSVFPKYRLAYKVERSHYNNAICMLNEEIIKSGLPVKVVPSLGHIIDIIPQGAGKGAALEYLRQILGFRPEHTIACGDSGNDVSMFLKGYKGIVVGNAHRELKLEIGKETHGTKDIYYAKKEYAAGILEGLIHHGVVDSKEYQVLNS